jgi:hypothetical protein
MKRFFLLIALVMIVSWLITSHRSPFRRPDGPTRHWTAERRSRESDVAGHRRITAETRRKTQRALAEAGAEVRQALDEAGEEVRQALEDARGEVHQAIDELRGSFAADDDQPPASPTDRRRSAPAKVEAEGLPVPIVPGTRVTEAKATPPTQRTSTGNAALAVSTRSLRSTVTGRLSATRERAVADARRMMRDDVASWLDPEVPRSWTPPVRLLDAVVVGEPQFKSIEKPYGEVFEATLTVDTSPQRRKALIEVYNRQLVERRLVSLGGTLAFILICLAAISGYIRADEATKGYYTNRLRMLAAAGVGASGVILYHMLV